MRRIGRREFARACAGAALAARWAHPLRGAERPAVRLPQPPPHEKLRPLIAPGADGFRCEAEAARVAAVLDRLLAERRLPLSPEFDSAEAFRADLTRWIDSLGEVRAARYFPLEDGLVRYEIASRDAEGLVYRAGEWRLDWDDAGRLRRFERLDETVAHAPEPLFADRTAEYFGQSESFREQLARGAPYWRARLDLASGIDLYGQNGIAAGDIDNDGWDEVFVCQPGGLPNRLYKRGRSGAFEDITERAGVGLLDDAASALFLDLRNSGLQDLVVLSSSGPVLFVNRGDGTFARRDDAFRFARPARGAFTGMAAADYDGDGRLDIYLCSYIYFQSEDQFSYPSPYHDSRNGPPNFLFRNRLEADGGGWFEDVTEAVGLDENNDRYSFAPAWCDYDFDGRPELYVANDFGRNNLYKFDGRRFRDIAAEAGVEDLGPGMSAAWFDAFGSGRPDLYVTNMWSAAGRRVQADPAFAPVAEHGLADEYRRHAKGNTLYRNRGDGGFDETGEAEMGRWAWTGDAFDFDLDGRPEILVAAGMITEPADEAAGGADLMSFFWRQVVAKTSLDSAAPAGYRDGWNALNQFVREGVSWNGGEPNVFYRFEGGRAVDVSGVSGLDVALDSRAFAAIDLDGDGRLDILLKNRLAPQVQAFRNRSAGDRHVIVLELQGVESNRDAIGAWVTAEHGGGRSSAGLHAGSGYLCQHTKRLHLGLGASTQARKLTVRWPSGRVEVLEDLAAERRYRIVEGRGVATEAPLEAQPVPVKPASAIAFENRPLREATWLIEPVPLPERVEGPGFVTIAAADSPERLAWYALFQRYLLDYRGAFETPLTLLVDGQSRAHKVYFRPPTEAERAADLGALAGDRLALALPFSGEYLRPPSRGYFRHGAAFYQAGFHTQALPYFEAESLRHPENFKALAAVAQIHLAAGDAERARPVAEAALRLRPDAPEAWNNAGGLAMAEGDAARAAEAFERSLALDADAPYALANLGAAYSGLGRLADAERVLRRAAELSPGDADVADRLGLAIARQGRLDEAKTLFEQAIRADRAHVPAIVNLAVVYLQQGKPGDAVAALRFGIRAAPQDERLYLNLAKVYVQQGDRERARDTMRELLSIRPDSAVARNALRELGLP